MRLWKDTGKLKEKGGPGGHLRDLRDLRDGNSIEIFVLCHCKILKHPSPGATGRIGQRKYAIKDSQ